MLPSAVHLLPTPDAYSAERGGSQDPEKRPSDKAKYERPTSGPSRGGPSFGLEDAVEHLLPTPRATRGGSHTETMALLPTPRTKNNENRQSEGYGGEAGNFYGLIHGGQDWRQYDAAIRRAELATGRTAPAPTETGPKGKPRLSPAFVEWLMMLPAGHVTNPAIGLTRNEQLKALGNGVVPAQAAAALRAYIQDEKEKAA